MDLLWPCAFTHCALRYSTCAIRVTRRATNSGWWAMVHLGSSTLVIDAPPVVRSVNNLEAIGIGLDQRVGGRVPGRAVNDDNGRVAGRTIVRQIECRVKAVLL